jgi:hypothetical protein
MPLRDLSGQTIARWLVLEQAPSRTAPSGQRRTYWLCRCTCGTVREVLALQLNSGGSLSCGCHRSEATGRRNADRRKGVVNYYRAHRRVDEARAPAKHHTCTDCGGPAAEWSYDHADQAELIDERGRAYSLDLDRYAPRCRPCHRTFDGKTRTANA